MVVSSNNFENDKSVQTKNRLIQQFMNEFNDEKKQKVTNNNNKMFGAKQLEQDYDLYDNEDAFDDEDEDEEDEEDEEEVAIDDAIENLYDELYSQQDYYYDNDINDELFYTINALQSYYDENQMKSLNKQFAASQANYMKNYNYLQRELRQYYNNQNQKYSMQQKLAQKQSFQGNQAKQGLSKSMMRGNNKGTQHSAHRDIDNINNYYGALYSWYNGYNEWSPQGQSDESSDDAEQGSSTDDGVNVEKELQEQQNDATKQAIADQKKKTAADAANQVKAQLDAKKKADKKQEAEAKEKQDEDQDGSASRDPEASGDSDDGGNESAPPPQDE